MSASDSKKTKRRKIKNAVSKTTAASSNASTNGTNPLSKTPSHSQVEDEKTKLKELMRDSEYMDIVFSVPRSKMFPKEGPNLFTKENCLLCGCELVDPPKAAQFLSEISGNTCIETEPVKLPLWVCASCRKAADSELLDKKDADIPFLDQDLQPETIPFPFLPDMNLDSTEPFTANGTICNCEACKERRQIADEYSKETQELQKSWVELRQMIQSLYQSEDPYLSESERIQLTDLVVKLCSRDPHQLFLRLESQIRDLVIEKKVCLIQQLNKGYNSLSEAQQFIHMLLEEYGQICRAARITSECLADLKDHLKRFKVTWDLHNKHLFQNIVYSYPAIHHSLPSIRETLRKGVSDPDNMDDSYPNLLCRFLKFQDEMSVILVVWRDCQILIENYNEEQQALKVKQKWLKEDWEFFKDQRKLLEEQVLKNPKTGQTTTHNMEAQFTETMRNLLQGTRPSVEECHCPRCNRKRCPCDECTITHMITCGIINPDALENTSTTHTFNFPHDPNFPPDSSNYFLDVHPPSVSSSNCSSGSSSPIMVDRERLIQPFGDCPEDFENVDIPEEIVDDSQSDDDSDDDEEEEDDDEEEEEEEEEDEGSDGFDPSKSKFDEASSAHNDLQNWISETTESDCDCHHCVGPKTEQMFQDPYPCQCHLCLQQPPGHILNTALPQPLPMSTQPTDLHIYPHIHGYPGLHGLQHGRQHVRSILQPQLYNLHNNPLLTSKLPGKIDFDSPGTQEHLYPAFGDWDNDPHGFLGTHQYGGSFPTDLLPPPPLPTNNPFITDPLLISSQHTTVPISPSTSSAFKTVPHSHVPTPNIPCSSSHDPVHFEACAKVSTSCSSSTNSTVPSKPAGPPCTRPVTLGGNTTSQTSCSDKGHTQHCLKHNPHPVDKADSRGHGKPSSMQNNLEATHHKHHGNNIKHSGNVKHGGKEDVAGKGKATGNAATSVPHTCSHGNKVHKPINSNHGSCVDHPMVCQNSVNLPTSINNVSVGTSTLCADPDCDGLIDDNCDSIDDTCSDKSSSTSSNQREGKYCDCCYCEFFGHGNQQVTTSRKKASEMQEKLRKKLSQKNEVRSDDGSCYSHACLKQKEEKSEKEGLEDLVNYINGVHEGKSKSSLKKQKQKQRKAEEKAKQDELEEKKRRKAERKLRKKLAVAAESPKPEVLERNGSIDSQESLGKKQGKKLAKSWNVDSGQASTITPSSSSANQTVPAPKEQGTAKGKGSKLKEDAIRKSTSSPTTPIKEVQDLHKGSRPQTPKQQQPPNTHHQIATNKQATQQPTAIVQHQANSQDISTNQKKGKLEQKLKAEVRKSPTPEPSNKNTQGKKTITNVGLTPKQVQAAKQNINAKTQVDPSKSLANNSTKSVQPKLIVTTDTKQAVIDRTQSKSSPREVKSATTNDKAGKKKDVSVKQPENNPTQSPRSQSQPKPTVITTQTTSKQQPSKISRPTPAQTKLASVVPTPTPPATKLPTSSPQIQTKSKKKEGKQAGVPNGIIPGNLMNGDVNNAQVKVTNKSSLPVNGSVVPEKPQEQAKTSKSKNKKKKKKGRGDDTFDEIFLPRSESDIENGELDDMEKEIEGFKRFCLDSPQPPVKEKMQVQINLKDIFTKKKLGLGCG